MAIKLNIQTPKQSLSIGFRKQRPLRSEIETFKSNLVRLLNKVDEIEREENQKNHVRDFLRDTYYKETNEINTKDSKDLVIHLGKSNKDKVGVIIEAKRPSNKNEMLTSGKPNTKAFQELVLYYLRERIEENNNNIQYCIATNIYEWYIIEASYFEKLFFRNKAFVKEYEQWRDGKKVTKDTNLFYNEVAKPFIDGLDEEINCTYFDIRDFDKTIKNENAEDDKNLIALLKILSPFHLLKVPFSDDSNKLNEKFYKELLHIIGLEETKKGGKTVIDRKEEGKRNSGSLIENAIAIIETENPLHKITEISNYGKTREEQVFNIALELCITWINRILFLKLLEGQLVTYHKGDRQYRFLNSETINDFDELYKLFHQVLAKTHKERTQAIQQKYSRVPYLNSSLFEIEQRGLEELTIKINSLDNSETLPLINTTVLKELKKKNDKLPMLEYLFKFLDSFDFASEGTEDIQEDENKTLINASVLGKVFEKINGYKDGSIFTPGFITMYMCRQSIRLAVMEKFREKYGWNIEQFEDIKNYLADRKSSKDILEFNGVINSLLICDPAVGSGHFLVSALNEIIAIKSELGLLADDKGSRITDYEIVIVNDELTVKNLKGDFFQYQLEGNKHIPKEAQRLQKTLFHEKEVIIENCLFGVDINPKSVLICRLRLWIELLKNAYYKEPELTELETLPNIDINIKCGNSLMSRFPLDSDLKPILEKEKLNIKAYRNAIHCYHKATNKVEKQEFLNLILKIKNTFKNSFVNTDPRRRRLSNLRGQLTLLENQKEIGGLFEKLSDKDIKDSVLKIKKQIKELEDEIAETKSNEIYKNAFEWRFEFPEVLNNNGDFEGFDLVIGNPPYIRIQELNEFVETYKSIFKSAKTGNYDIYVLFIEKCSQLLNPLGNLQFILPHKFLIAEFGKGIREVLHNSKNASEIIHFGHEMIFEGVTTYTCLLSLNNKVNLKLKFAEISSAQLANEIDFIELSYENIPVSEPWIFKQNESSSIIERLTNLPLKIGDVLDKVFSGIQTSADKIYSIIGEENNGLIVGKSKNGDENVSVERGLVKPLIKGDDIKRYSTIQSNTYVIFPYLLEDGEANPMSEEYIRKKFPRGYSYLKKYESDLRGREKSKMDFDGKWFLYNYPKNLFLSNQVKLVSPDITFGMNITKESGNFCVKNGAYGITIKPKYKKFENEIIAVLNSKLLWYYLQNTGNVLRGGYFRFNTKYILPFPLPDFTKLNTSALCKLVDKSFEAKQKGKDSNDYEKKIDELVYELYGLSEEEIKIIEHIAKK